ncbi:MAG: hypothetical protein EU547_07060 [Promethearchaeota archaeon]|nr:MAG: hypothetical protein EU547_07060 [Candidatus Lokiarchaeota archaeon]
MFLLLDILQDLANIIGAIVMFLKPFVTPIGEFMIYWINFALSFFPTESWIIYIIIFAVFIIAGIFVNCYWPGDKPPEEEKEAELAEPKIGEEDTDFIDSFDLEEEGEEPKLSEEKDDESEKGDKEPIM